MCWRERLCNYWRDISWRVGRCERTMSMW